MRKHLFLAAAALVLAVGCGTTVQPQQLAGAGTTVGAGTDSGLSAPAGALPQQHAVQPGTTAGGSGGVPLTRGGGGGGSGSGAAPVPRATAGTPITHGGVSGPLQVGIAYINNQQASAALGTNDPRTNAVKTVVEAYVRAINAHGGLDGRKIVPVEYEWHSGDGSWSTAAAAACAKFTQDNHVPVVLDEAFGTTGGFRDCLQRAGVFDITNQGVGDDVSSSQAPLHAGTGFGSMTVDGMYGAVLRQEVRSGYLSAKNQLGIIIESCPENQRAYSRTLLPLIRNLGLHDPKTYSFDCVDSVAAGAGAGQAAISNAILRFRQPPVVDRVMFVSGEEAAALLLFGATASSQSYHPGYLLSTYAQAHLAPEKGSGFPSDQLPQIHGVGNMPTGDVSASPLMPVDKRCLALIRPVGVVPANYDDTGQALFACGPFLLLDAALRLSHGDASAGALAPAIASLGSSFAAPGMLDSAARYSRSDPNGGYLVQTFSYVAACQCIRYAGEASPVS